MSRKPDYRVAALLKNSEHSGNIGAAWANDDGSIAIVLNSFVKIPYNRSDLLITLFPNKDVK